MVATKTSSAVPVRVEKLLQECCGWSKASAATALRLRLVRLRSPLHPERAHATLLYREQLVFPEEQLWLHAQPHDDCAQQQSAAEAEPPPPPPLQLPAVEELAQWRRCYALHKPSGLAVDCAQRAPESVLRGRTVRDTASWMSSLAPHPQLRQLAQAAELVLRYAMSTSSSIPAEQEQADKYLARVEDAERESGSRMRPVRQCVRDACHRGHVPCYLKW